MMRFLVYPDNQQLVSQQVCGRWSCKLANYPLLTCDNVACQKRAKKEGWLLLAVSIAIFLVSQLFNWNLLPLTCHILPPPTSMNHKTHAPCRTLLRHQSNHPKKEQVDWPLQWWVLQFFIWSTIQLKLATPDLLSNSTLPFPWLQTPQPVPHPPVGSI